MRRLKEFLKQLKAESAKQQYPPFGDEGTEKHAFFL